MKGEMITQRKTYCQRKTICWKKTAIGENLTEEDLPEKYMSENNTLADEDDTFEKTFLERDNLSEVYNLSQQNRPRKALTIVFPS